MSPTDDHPELISFKQLPAETDAVFALGDNLVRFTPHRLSDALKGWHVTTTDAGYAGYLTPTSDTVWVRDRPEPEYGYTFEWRSPGGPFVTVAPTPVTIIDLREKFFGAYALEESITP